ncbi:MAG: glycosyltransferase family 4 protein [Candidatus Krumholzibacteriota bacterium]|nr:glycosyltransferase family 4 protein [Candidatus Krumholzibacteriota bacterium]
MKIVIALSYSPYPIRSGTDRLVMNLIRGLSERHHVKLVTMTLEKQKLEKLREIENERVSVTAIIAPQRRGFAGKLFCKVKNILLLLFSRIPLDTLYAAPGRYLKLVTGVARSWKADLVMVNYWHLYKLHKMLKGFEVVLVTHDLDYLVHPGRISSTSGFFRRRLKSIDIAMKIRVEEEAYRSFDKILTVNVKEAEELKKYIDDKNKSVKTLPMAIDLRKFDPSVYRRKHNRVLLIGNFASDFNADALDYMVNSIFPLILKERPGTILDIVGAGVPEKLKKEKGDEIIFRGRVEDVVPYLGKCSTLVIPLRFAGGVRIRMLEAAAMGVPVVSTPVGVRGMNLCNGREYIEASGAEEFASAVLKVLEDEELAREISKNVRCWAEKEISLRTYPERLQNVLEAFESES